MQIVYNKMVDRTDSEIAQLFLILWVVIRSPLRQVTQEKHCDD